MGHSDDFRPPDAAQLELLFKLLEPWRRLTAPSFFGVDEIPERRPLLFVGNHTIYGMLDIPLMFAELQRRRGIFLRSLGDHAHFAVPLWGSFLRRFGAVDGTRENCARLMAEGQAILVFPGGGREVAKRKGERYQLMWKERLGFARLALEHGCTVVPFAAVGADDAYDIVLDSGDLLASPLGPVLQKLGVREELLMPLGRGLLGSPLPRPEKLYFRFGPALEVQRCLEPSVEQCRELRDRVRGQVQAAIDELLAHRENDPERPLLRRLGRVS